MDFPENPFDKVIDQEFADMYTDFITAAYKGDIIL